MTSKPILIIGPPASGKTHIALAIMGLFHNAWVQTNASDAAKIANWAMHPHIKLVIVENVPDALFLSALWSDLKKFEAVPAFVFTSQSDIEAPKEFSVIHCNNKY